MKSSLKVVVLMLGLIVAGCAGGGGRMTSFIDPPCMPDGSPVWVQYPNSEGSFEGAMADLGKCPWYQLPSRE